jgi:hypothetical protein
MEFENLSFFTLYYSYPESFIQWESEGKKPQMGTSGDQRLSTSVSRCGLIFYSITTAVP